MPSIVFAGSELRTVSSDGRISIEYREHLRVYAGAMGHVKKIVYLSFSNSLFASIIP